MEMIAFIKSQCPACGQMADVLLFWRKLGNARLAVCEDCQKRDLTEEEKLRSAFRAGYVSAILEVKNSIKDARFPDIGTPPSAP